MDIKGFEKIIVEYFELKKERKMCVLRCSQLEALLGKQEYDLKTNNFILDDTVGAVRYDSEKTSGGNFAKSPIEQELERVVSKLEKRVSECKKEIELLNNKIDLVDIQTSKMDGFFTLLSDDEVKLLEYRYIYNKTPTKISIDLNISVRNIYRKISEIVHRYIKFNEYIS